jgi:hypothetical protein
MLDPDLAITAQIMVADTRLGNVKDGMLNRCVHQLIPLTALLSYGVASLIVWIL